MAVLGMAAVLAPIVLAFVPARWFEDTGRARCVATADDGTCTEEVYEPAEFALVPADAEPVAPLLDVRGVVTYVDDGDVYFVTVREPAITMLDWFVTHDNPATRLRSRYDKFGDLTAEERLREGQRQMTGAKEWAIYVALTRAGYDIEPVPGPAVVDYVLCLQPNDDGTECLESPPSEELLEPLDTVTAIDGEPVVVLDDISRILADREPGDVVSVTVERGEEEITGDVELIASPDEPDRPIIGFMPVDTTTLPLPDGFSVDFSTGSIGGPSAGLAFTLTLLDMLTEGDLTGDQRIAVTGTINPDGTVGAIGGLNSKASAVQQVGVDYFLVPANQPESGPDSIAAAREVVGDDVEIIPVATLDEALEVLERLGGDPLPPADDLAAERG